MIFQNKENNMKEQRIVTPDNLDPDVFTVKTVDSKNYITVNVGGGA